MSLERVSHSEAESYLSCRRKHFYGYIKEGGLKPKIVSKGLSRGSFVHEILEVYYNHILEAGDTNKLQRGARKEAEELAREYYDKQIKAGEYDDENLQSGRRSVKEMLFEYYFPNESIVSAGWTVQAVELKIALHVDLDEETEYQYPFVIDLIALDPEGRTVVIDHKCVYDFYSSEDVDLLSQLPKYLAGLRAGEYPADYAAYNMIRNRSKKNAAVEDVVQLLPVKPSAHTVQQVFIEQISVASDVINARSHLSEEEADQLAFRSASTITCRNCDFRDICVSERVGADITPALAVDYERREAKPFKADISIE